MQKDTTTKLRWNCRLKRCKRQVIIANRIIVLPSTILIASLYRVKTDNTIVKLFLNLLMQRLLEF